MRNPMSNPHLWLSLYIKARIAAGMSDDAAKDFASKGVELDALQRENDAVAARLQADADELLEAVS